MDIAETIILSIIQGITEFLPISSSAHLILLPQLTGYADQGLAFDIVLHLGTLTAIVLYYRKDIGNIIYMFFTENPNKNNNAKIGWGLVIATIPVGIFGILFKDYVETELRSIEVIAYATLFFGLLLGLADYLHKQKSTLRNSIEWRDIIIVGMFQALALIPGTSRSGITITAGLLLGLNYKLTTKFSFLLSIPVIALSSGLIILNLLEASESVNWSLLVIGFSLSSITAYITIYFFIKFINKIGMLPFVVYRLILWIFLLFMIK